MICFEHWRFHTIKNGFGAGNGVKGVFVCLSSSSQYQPINEACDAAEAQKQCNNNNNNKKTQ